MNFLSALLAAVSLVTSDWHATDGAKTSAEIPSEWRGKRITVEFDLENAGERPFGNGLAILQLDAEGKELPEQMVDPRFITQMRPAKNRHRLSCNGSVHPRAAKAVLRVAMRDPGLDFKPELIVHSAAIRLADKVEPNPKFLTKGVAGNAFDMHEGRALCFPVYSRACWGQGKVVTEVGELYYPTAEGTVEAWLKLEDGGAESYRIFEAANFSPGASNAHRTRGTLMSLDWAPKKGEIMLALKGSDGKLFKAKGETKLADGAWHHLAATFDPKGEAAIYVDGKRVAATSLTGWKAPKTGLEEEGAMMFFLGGGFMQIRRADNDPAERGLVLGAVDDLRVSSAVRYRGDFTPAKGFKLDGDTRALFEFEDGFDGVSAGGGGIVESGIVAKEGRDKAGNGTGAVAGAPRFEDENCFDVLNYKELPSEADLTSLRRHSRRSFEVKAGESFGFDLPKGIFADFTEIANTGKTPLVAPLVIAPDEVDPRTFETIAATLHLDGLSDREKVDRIFQYLIHSTDYFIWHPAVVPPMKHYGEGQNNLPLKLLNGYCGTACGGLNNLTACAFVQAGRVPADRVKGYGHEFECCLLDGKSRLYDLSGQQFFRSFADGEPASLQDVDREYGLHARYGKNPDHFSRLFAHSPMMANPYFEFDYLMTLSPGESFAWWRRNDGALTDVGYSKGKHKRSEHPLVADAPAECKISGAFVMNRTAPDLANGFLRFDGVPDVKSPAFAASDKTHLVYRAEPKYTITRGEYRAELADGTAAKLEWSADGKKWYPLAADEDGTARPTYAIRGRSLVFVRALAKPAEVRRFAAVSEVQMNPRVSTGLARAGKNELKFIAEGGGAAKITIGWGENAAPIEVSPVAWWGTVRGAERMLAAVDPMQGATELKVKGVKAVKSGDPRLEAKLDGEKLELSWAGEKEKGAYIAQVELSNGTGTVAGAPLKTLTVIVGKGARLIFANAAEPMQGVKLRKEGEKVAIALPKLDDEKYFVFNLERLAGALSADRTHARPLCMIDPRGKKRKERQLDCGGGGGEADFYKAGYGVKGGRGNLRWDTAKDPRTNYPMGSPRLFQGTQLPELSFSLAGDVKDEIEFFAALVVPEGDFAFRGELYKLLFGLNYDPRGGMMFITK